MSETDFDQVIDRRGTFCGKWDAMETLFGVSPQDGLAMWVADMDFLPPPAVNAALAQAVDHGIHGYYGPKTLYHDAIRGWMQRRHGWAVEEEWILTCHGLVSATGIAIQAFSAPGDGVILFTPVYHAFHKMIKANDREIVQSPLVLEDGQYRMDLEALRGQLSGRERIVILCSPHNPGGRVWRRAEIAALAAFCAEHDLVLVSDEVHHDLTMPGQTHVIATHAAPEHLDRIVVLSAASKTFGLAGGMCGQAIIPDPALRDRFSKPHIANGASPNRFGIMMTEAAYTHGEDWLEALRLYLDGNRQLFDAGMAAIPGVASMPLEATYLAWVDFAGTGMDLPEVLERVEGRARIAANHGPEFGQGGESFLRFNLAMPRARVAEAVSRLQEAFSDLQ
ncbi:MAG: MalY/PatB family protein [Pseudomonadota bacterium]